MTRAKHGARRALFCGLLVLVGCCGTARAVEGPQLTLAGGPPPALVLGASGGAADGRFAVVVRNDSAVAARTQAYVLLDDGGTAELGSPHTVGSGAASTTYTLARVADPQLPPHGVRSVQFRLSALASPGAADTTPLRGTLVVGLAGAPEVAPLTVALAASVRSAAAGSAAIDFGRARIEPAAVFFKVDFCPFSPYDETGDCPAPHPQPIVVEDLTVAADVEADELIASTVAAADSGGTARVEVRTAERVVAGATRARFDVSLDGVTRNGSYEVELPLSTAERAPAVTVGATARDCFGWALLAILLGAILAYVALWLRDVVRARKLLEHALLDLAARHERDRAAAGPDAWRYPLTATFPGDKAGWDEAAVDGRPRAVELLRRIAAARRKDELDEVLAEVRVIEEIVDEWPHWCGEARRLQALISELLPFGELAPALRAASEAVLAAQPAAVSGKAKAHTDALVAQQRLIERWDEVRRRLALLLARSTGTEWQPALLALRERLTGATDGEALEEIARRLEQIGEHLPPQTMLLVKLAGADAVRRAQGRGSAGHVVATIGPARAAARTRIALARLDALSFWIAFAIAVGVYFVGFYPDGAFGSGWQYLAAFFAGASVQLAVNWQLLPWFGSTRLPRPAT